MNKSNVVCLDYIALGMSWKLCYIRRANIHFPGNKVDQRLEIGNNSCR